MLGHGVRRWVFPYILFPAEEEVMTLKVKGSRNRVPHSKESLIAVHMTCCSLCMTLNSGTLSCYPVAKAITSGRSYG